MASTNLMQVNAQWSSRPDDERFTSLTEMEQQMRSWKDTSRAMVLSTRSLMAVPQGDAEHKGLQLRVNPGSRRGLESWRINPGTLDVLADPTHWSFGQLAQRAGAPAGYLRTLPAEMAADCINYGLMMRSVDEVGLLVRENGRLTTTAVTGPNYGRVYNHDIVKALIKRFGDGVNGQFRIPGEFGRPVPITKANTTLYASDRDMFVFLADEEHRIEVPNRRNGEPGSLARGFFVWNSEVGAATLGIKAFLYDYVCCNRIVWGAQDVKEIRIRHTSGAPDRFAEEVYPALKAYAESSTANVVDAIKEAKTLKLGAKDKVTDFLNKRFTKSQTSAILTAHEEEEGRPIETMWDAVVGATAYAKQIQWQDERVKVETIAGSLLD